MGCKPHQGTIWGGSLQKAIAPAGVREIESNLLTLFFSRKYFFEMIVIDEGMQRCSFESVHREKSSRGMDLWRILLLSIESGGWKDWKEFHA